MKSFSSVTACVIVLLASPVLAQQNTDCVNPTSDLGVEFYAQGGVVVDGIAYFTSDDGDYVPTGLRSSDFHSVVAFDVHTLQKVRTYHSSQTYDSSPFLFQKRDGTWLVIAREHENQRTVAFQGDNGQLEWTSADNQPGSYFFGYSSYRLDDGTQLILMACRNGLHAMSGETGEDLWRLKQRSTGGVTPCVDQQRGWIFYQCNGQVLKVRATDGSVLKSATVGTPNACISWNTVLVEDGYGNFVATRWYGKSEWDSAIRVYDNDLNLVWERTGLPIGKKDTLTYVDGKLVTGSGNHWSKKYEGDAWKYVAAYSITDGSIIWKCDLSDIPYESLFNLPYFNGYFYAETTGGKYGSSKLLRIRASDGALVETLDYGRSISSCAPCIIAHGRVLSGDLGEDRIVVTEIAENSKADWPGPFGHPQTNRFALTDEPGATLVPMKEIRPKGKGDLPYPPSEAITNLTIHPERISLGNGDNWPITWADDGDQYTVYCDGEGFGGGSGKGSMSLARIVGDPAEFNGENLASPTGHKTSGGPEGRKASGLVMVDGVLYMWVRNLNEDGTGSSLAWSDDHAATWTWADWSFPEIGYPTWLNAGKNYAAARDEFAYVYSPNTPSAYKTSNHMIVARVPTSEIRNEKAYRFFSGLDDDGDPRWTANFEQRKPVFTDPGHCYRPEVVFNPGISKYLLLTATSGAPRWAGTDEKYLGIFEASTPWGPWHTVKHVNGWGGDENRFQPRIPPRWIGEDGKTFCLLYSCFPEGPYQFNVQKCSLD